jgi:hypothetical protein
MALTGGCFLRSFTDTPRAFLVRTGEPTYLGRKVRSSDRFRETRYDSSGMFGASGELLLDLFTDMSCRVFLWSVVVVLERRMSVCLDPEAK